MTKVLVIGLDGGDWDLLNQLMEDGHMPRLKQMQEKSYCSYLKSSIPPITIPAWINFATGKNPGKHGCYAFVVPRDSLSDTYTVTTNDIKSKTFYEIIDESNKKSIIVNLPCSYPPRIKKTMITSFLGSSESFIFPESLKDEIEELKDYHLCVNELPFNLQDEEEYVKNVMRLEQIRVEVVKKLFPKEWDFFFFLFSGTDWIQHKIYRKLMQKSGDVSYNEALKYYRFVDDSLGWFLDSIDDDTILFIMSDHGFKVVEHVVNLNQLLINNNYLKFSSEEETAWSQIDENIRKKTIMLPPSVFRTFGFLAPVYNKVKKYLPFHFRITRVKPDIKNTIAYSGPVGPTIYINSKNRFSDGLVDEFDIPKIRDRIIELLHEVNTKHGSDLFSIHKKEDIYSGSNLFKSPDIVLNSIGGVAFSGSPTRDIVEPRDKSHFNLDNHRYKGMFMAYGKNIIPGKFDIDPNIQDLAPTILHVMNLPIPDDVDGKVMKEIFDRESNFYKKNPVFAKASEFKTIEKSKRDEEEIRERLKALGYL